jgi:glyoxylase-like metal-dependent hydrolase (beta-lactamase superfamily II)
MPVFKPIKITDHVYWVGAIDWTIRDFHGYTTKRGSTYNAYLILADKITLVDTVKAPFREELMARVSALVDPGKIDYIVSNHSEMDHSGCLAEVISDVRPEKVFASVMGARALKEHFRIDSEIIPVKDGTELNLGNLNLAFTETRMLHWPDSMFSYVKEERLLFSQDAFGMHSASSLIRDEVTGHPGLRGRQPFREHLLPYSQLILNLLDKVQKAASPSTITAPDPPPSGRETLSGYWPVRRMGAAEAQEQGRGAIPHHVAHHRAHVPAVEEGLATEEPQVKDMSRALTIEATWPTRSSMQGPWWRVFDPEHNMLPPWQTYSLPEGAKPEPHRRGCSALLVKRGGDRPYPGHHDRHEGRSCGRARQGKVRALRGSAGGML